MIFKLLILIFLAAGGWTCRANAQEVMPVTLEEGLRMALEQNEILRMAREDLRQSRERVREATADALPRLDISVTYNRNWLLPSFIFDTPTGRQKVSIGTQNNIDGTLSLRQPLFQSGRVDATRRAAHLSADVSEEGVRAVRQQVWASVETAFYDLLFARDLVRVSLLTLERARANLRQVEKLNGAGRVSRYEVLRARVQVSSLRPDSIRAQNRLVLARLNFKNAIGMDPDRQIEARGGFRQGTDLDLGSVDELIRTGLASRPEMRQVGRRVQVRQQDIRIARAASLPSLDLLASGRLQVQSNRFEFSREDVRQSWFTGVAIDIPLFDGLRTRAQVARAKADLRRTEIERQRLERDVALEIRQAWLLHREAEERLEAEALAVTQARQGLQIAESRYTNGAGTQLEVLDAQLVLSQAESEYARGQRDLAVALVGLEQAVGVLGETGGQE